MASSNALQAQEEEVSNKTSAAGRLLHKPSGRRTKCSTRYSDLDHTS